MYRVTSTTGETIECSNPSLLPEPGKRKLIEEPYVKIELLTPKDYIGPLMELAQERRGEFKEMKYITENRT
ncbi:elongation factor 4, partial [Mycobacterium kansasii]